MEKKDLVWVILISVILITIASFMLPVIMKGPDHGAGPNPPPQNQAGQDSVRPPPPPGQEESKQLKTLVSFINLGLIIPLFIIYAGIYQKLRSSFTLGLMAVIFALGMYALTSNPFLMSLFGEHAGQIGIFQIIPDLCATAALLILIRISLE